MAFFREQEVECPADFVLVCRKVKLLAGHSAVPVPQVGWPKHRAEFPAARRADWKRRRVDCDFRNLYPALRSVLACRSVLAEPLAWATVARLRFASQPIADWRRAQVIGRAMLRPPVMRQAMAAQQALAFRSD